MSFGSDLEQENGSANNEASNTSRSDGSVVAESPGHRLGQLIAKLPEEVLGEIFYWCCPTFDDRLSAPSMAILVLSHVCRRWRKVAFANPKLWTYTSLGAPRHNCNSATELMLLWVKNSKSCPLVIDIDFSTFAAFKAPDTILPTVLELSQLAAELKPAPSPDEVPLLVSVEPSVVIKFPYVLEEYYWTNDEMDPRNVGRNSLQLRVSTKPCILLGMDGHKDFGPYLVHLDLRDEDETICLTMDEALGILRMYQNLRHLTFRLGYPGDGLENLTLPHLKTLGISWCDEADPTPVLNSLSAPALQNLELDGQIPPNDFVEGNIWDPLRQFLHRSAPPLRSLNLYKIRCDDVDLLSCLGRLNGLERLWLEDCIINEGVVKDFTEARHPLAESAQLTLENLKSLGLVRCSIFNAHDIFHTLVVSGMIWSVTALDGLYLSDCHVHERVETWHLLRSRYESGAYDKSS